MAKVTIEGINDVITLLDNIADIPDDVIDEMLIAGGEVTKESLKFATIAKGVYDTGELYDSITLGKPKKDKTIDVTFKGTRKNRKTRNAEVAFIHEYGAPSRNIAARQFIRKAHEDAVDPATEAAARIFDDYMKKLK